MGNAALKRCFLQENHMQSNYKGLTTERTLRTLYKVQIVVIVIITKQHSLIKEKTPTFFFFYIKNTSQAIKWGSKTLLKSLHIHEDLNDFVKARPQQVRFLMATQKALGTEIKTHPFWHYLKLHLVIFAEMGKKKEKKHQPCSPKQTDSTAFIHPFRPPKNCLV